MKYITIAVVFAIGLISGCGRSVESSESVTESSGSNTTATLVGKWITEADGSVMVDPQTSGLAVWREQLLSISDGSAHETQRRRIHVLNPASAQLQPKPAAMSMSSRVRKSCFANYLSGQPDLEALVVDPDDENVFYTVTEDATRSGAMSPRCQKKYENSGSTDYPTVLVRLERSDSGKTTMTHARALKFDTEFGVGNFPNDGIEGMAITPEKLLYLGLEKDKQGKARIFSVPLNDEFWTTSEFAKVTDPNLQLPTFLEGNHPINALTRYAPNDESGVLIAAARNDNEIWIIDEQGNKPAKRVEFNFAVEIMGNSQCGDTEIMDNASIEGVAVIDDTLWLVNDPWKRNYLKNIQCPDNAEHYNSMAPVLFSTPILKEWLL